MRLISGQVSSVLRSTTSISDSAKQSAELVDIEHAKFFESAGSQAIYCIDHNTTWLQFIGAHENQRHALLARLENASASAELYAMSRCGMERLNRTRAREISNHCAYRLFEGCVHEKAGPRIAYDMRVEKGILGTAVTFQPGPDYRASPTEQSALRMIALEESIEKFGAGTTVTRLAVGMANITFPQAYMGPLTSIAGHGQALGAQNRTSVSLASGKCAQPWYELA